jgi:hypothetical protein
VGRCRPPLPILLLHHSLPLLGLELTLHPIPCLAEQGRRHHRRNPKVTIDEHGRAPHLELFFQQDLDAEEFRSYRRRPAATQPPSTTLGEPRLRAYSSKGKGFPQPRRDRDDGPPPSIFTLIGWTTSSGTDSVPMSR